MVSYKGLGFITKRKNPTELRKKTYFTLIDLISKEAKDHPLLLTKYTFFSQLVANYLTVFFLYENCDKATHLEKLEYIKQIKGLNKAAEHSKNSTMFESFFGVQNEPLFFELLCHRTTIEKLYYELTATKFTTRSLRSTSS